jgi:hypothetical protein
MSWLFQELPPGGGPKKISNSELTGKQVGLRGWYEGDFKAI